MARTLNLSLPSPCSEKWSSFTQTPDGGFCSSCSKVVIDFTKMSDDEIVRYFQGTRGNTCGRFSQDQLKTYHIYPPAKLRTGLPLFKAGLLAALFVLTRPSASHAQIQPQQKEQVENDTTTSTPIQTHTFRGMVRAAEDHEPLPGVNIVLKGTSVGTITDAHGGFEFPQKLKQGDVLVFSFIGLRTKEYVIEEKRDLNVEIPMALCMDYDLTGEVVVAGIYTEPRQTLWSKVKGLFTK
jgi:hypothetical protein